MPEEGALRPRPGHKCAAVRPAALLKQSGRAGLLASVFLIGTLFGRCDGLNEFLDPYQLPVRGLSLAPAGDQSPTGAFQETAPALIWTLNVGILNDSEFPELAVADLRPILDETVRRLREALPGIEVRFIIDQPMNSVFLIERSVRKKGFLAPKYDPEGGVLRLSSGAADVDRNRAVLSAAGASGTAIARELALLDALTDNGCLAEKLPASEYVWRAYMARQVRYDLIITNALVYADDLATRMRPADHAIFPWQSGGPFVRAVIAPTNGRSALEGHGALVSLFGSAALPGSDGAAAQRSPGSDSRAADGAERPVPHPALCLDTMPARAGLPDEDVLAAIIFQLLRPADFSAASADLWKSPAGYLAACGPACASAWERRRHYLAAMVSLEAGGGESACERLESHYADYALSGAEGEAIAGPTLNAERAGQYRRNHVKFQRLCGKKR